MVYINGTFYYEIYTSKDYNFKIGEIMNITDFKSNDNYKELRPQGHFPANGYDYNTSDAKRRIITGIYINRNGYYFANGWNITDDTYNNSIGISDHSYAVVQLS